MEKLDKTGETVGELDFVESASIIFGSRIYLSVKKFDLSNFKLLNSASAREVRVAHDVVGRG